MNIKSKKIKTEWNLGLLYTSLDDSKLESDMRLFERTAEHFQKKWQKRTDYLTDKKVLKRALLDYEKSAEILYSPKSWWYASLSLHMDSENKKASALQTKYEERYIKAKSKNRFFSLALGTITLAKQKEFLAAKELARYRYTLEKTFENAKYNLTEKEEDLMSLMSIPAGSLWNKMTEKEIHKLTARVKGKDMPLQEAQSRIPYLPKAVRRKVAHEIAAKLGTIADVAASEMNAIVIDHKISDEKRGFTHPYSSTILSYENDERTVLGLVQAVTDHFHISHRFFKLHARLLGEKKLEMCDRGVEIGKISKKFAFADAVKITRDALASVDPEYVDIFDTFLTNGQIDAYPRKTKHAGGYCWGIRGCPTFILLNHNDSVRSVETLGHEMGHALHSELADKQPIMYADYSTSVAETASTFFEQVTTERIMDTLPEKDRIIMLHAKIGNDIASIFRQIACFNFERELHERVRAEGELNSSDIAKLMQKHLASYVGPAIGVTEGDGRCFVTWSHIRNFFYVYTYAYGQLISKSLFVNWKKDRSVAAKVRQFLEAGSNDTPENIFKKIGIDVTNPAFFKAGLNAIENDIAELERLAFKKGKNKKK